MRSRSLPSPAGTSTYFGSHGKSGRSAKRSSGVRKICIGTSCPKALRLRAVAHLTEEVVAPTTRCFTGWFVAWRWHMPTVHRVHHLVAPRVDPERDRAEDAVVRHVRVRTRRRVPECVRIRRGKCEQLFLRQPFGELVEQCFL